MGKVISFINEKGGVTKTTTSVNVAWILANVHKKKVLLVDYDGQGNATQNLGMLAYLNKDSEFIEKTLDDIPYATYDLMNLVINDKPLPPKEKFIYKLNGVDLIAGNYKLGNIEKQLAFVDMGKEKVLKIVIDYVKDDYDYVIIDSLPCLDSKLVNALFASDYTIIPSNTSDNSISGIVELAKVVDRVKKNGNDKLKILGILITLYKSNVNIQKQNAINIYSAYDDNIYVFNSIIPYSAVVEEGVSANRPWAAYKPEHIVSIKYKEFTKELLKQEEAICQ